MASVQATYSRQERLSSFQSDSGLTFGRGLQAGWALIRPDNRAFCPPSGCVMRDGCQPSWARWPCVEPCTAAALLSGLDLRGRSSGRSFLERPFLQLSTLGLDAVDGGQSGEPDQSLDYAPELKPGSAAVLALT